MSSLPQANWQNELGIKVEDFDGLFYKSVPTQLLANPLVKKDIWRTVEDLGLEIQEHQKILTFDFAKIHQTWLKILAKLYILSRVSLKLSASYLGNHISHFKKFSRFLKEKDYYIVNIKQINDQLFEEFRQWLRATKIKKRSISLHYTSLQNLFDTCRIEGWLDVNTYWFQGRKTPSKANPEKVEYIPEEIWNQLEEHLHHLPDPMQRKILLIRTLGLRIGELLNLPWDCLRKRGKNWHIRLKETEKFEVQGDELPITLELVAIIKEQQKYIRKHLGENYNKLFGSNQGKSNFSPVARVMNVLTFNTWLNRLATRFNICTKEGELWRFSSHQFRKTVGTILTNAGIRDLIIQKYLRHRSPDMQDYYKQLFKEVIGEEYDDLLKEKKYVDITGKVVATHKPDDAIAEYMRRRMHQITTQVGECHRPNLKKPCPTVNACNRCQHWRTTVDDLPFLKQDLERLKKEEEIAQNLGLIRNQKELEKDLQYFQARINGLEEVQNNG